MSTIDKEIFNTFGDALLSAIEFNGLNPAIFSREAGIDEGQLSKYINNKTTPRPRKVQELERNLNVNFIKEKNKWRIIPPNHAQEAIDLVDRVREQVIPYKDKEPTLDDLPELVRLKKLLEEKIDKLIK